MQAFHLIKTSQARPFALLLQDMGVAIDEIAEEAGLPPATLWNQIDGVIGEFALWQFIEAGAARNNYDLLGFECAEAYPLTIDNRLGDLPIRFGKTLEHTLHNFNEDVLQLSTACYYSLDRRSGSCWFRRIQAFGREHASWQTELYIVAILLQLIQAHMGHDWMPAQIRFSAKDTLQTLPYKWSTVKAHWGAEATGIELPDTVLALPPAAQTNSRRKRQTDSRPNFWQLVATQVNTGCIGVDNAAKQTGISVSSLQRNLRASGTTYQEILDKVRHKMARELLSKTTSPIESVATSLGYTHHGNFTRAFVRWEGVTPATYRAGL